MSTEQPTPWEQARRTGIELAAKLIVRMGEEVHLDEYDGSLVVDCEAIMRSENDVRYWVLWPDPDGTWSHGPSGETGHPLSELLQSIALCYSDRLNPSDGTDPFTDPTATQETE